MATRDESKARLFSRSLAGFGARPRHLAHIKDSGPIADDYDETASTPTSGELASSSLNNQTDEKPQRTEEVKSSKQHPPLAGGKTPTQQKLDEDGRQSHTQHRTRGNREPKDVVDEERGQGLSRGDSLEERRAQIGNCGRQKPEDDSSSVTKPSFERRDETPPEDSQKGKHYTGSKYGGSRTIIRSCREGTKSHEDSATSGSKYKSIRTSLSRAEKQKLHEGRKTSGLKSEGSRTASWRPEKQKSHEGRETSGLKSEGSRTASWRPEKQKSHEGSETSGSKSEGSRTASWRPEKQKSNESSEIPKAWSHSSEKKKPEKKPTDNPSSAHSAGKDSFSPSGGTTGQKSGAAKNTSSELKTATVLPKPHSNSVQSEPRPWTAPRVSNHREKDTPQSTPASGNDGKYAKPSLERTKPGLGEAKVLDQKTICDNDSERQSSKAQKTSSGETRTKNNSGEKSARPQRRTPIKVKERPRKQQEEVDSSPEVHSKPKRPSRRPRDPKNTEQLNLTEAFCQLDISPVKDTPVFNYRNFIVQDWHDSLDEQERKGPVGAEASAEELIGCLGSEFNENVQIMDPPAPPSGLRHNGISSRGRGRPPVSKVTADPNNNAYWTSSAHQKRPSDSESEVAPSSRRFCGEDRSSISGRPLQDEHSSSQPVIDLASGSVFQTRSEPASDYVNLNVRAVSPNRPTTFAQPSGMTPLVCTPTPPYDSGWQRTPSPYSGSSGSSLYATPPEPSHNRKVLGYREPAAHLFAEDYRPDTRADRRGFSHSPAQSGDGYQGYHPVTSRGHFVQGSEQPYHDAGNMRSHTVQEPSYMQSGNTQADGRPDQQHDYDPCYMETRVWSPQEMTYGPRYHGGFSSYTRREELRQQDSPYNMGGRGEFVYHQSSPQWIPGHGRPGQEPSPRGFHHSTSPELQFGNSNRDMFRQPPPPPPPIPNRTPSPLHSRPPPPPPPLEDSVPGTVRAALGRGRGRPMTFSEQRRSPGPEPPLPVQDNVPNVRILKRGEDLPLPADVRPEQLPEDSGRVRYGIVTVHASHEQFIEVNTNAPESRNDVHRNIGNLSPCLDGLSTDAFLGSVPALQVVVPEPDQPLLDAYGRAVKAVDAVVSETEPFLDAYGRAMKAVDAVVPEPDQPLFDAYGRAVNSVRMGECGATSQDSSCESDDNAEGTGHECLASNEESEDTDSRAYISANETLSPKPPVNRSFERSDVSVKSQVTKVSNLVHDSTPSNSLENESPESVGIKTSARSEVKQVDHGQSPRQDSTRTSDPAPPGFSPLDVIKENYYSDTSPPPPGFYRNVHPPQLSPDVVEESRQRPETGWRSRPVIVHKFVTLGSKTTTPSASISSTANGSNYKTPPGRYPGSYSRCGTTAARTTLTYSHQSSYKSGPPQEIPRVYDMNFPALSAAGIKTTASNPDPRPRLVQSTADFPWAPASHRNKTTQRRSWGSIGQKDYSPLLKADVSPTQRPPSASSTESLEFIPKESPKRDWKLLHRYRLDSSDVPYIDSHCHIDFLLTRSKYYGSWSSYRQENADTFMKNYEGCITNFCDPNSYKTPGKWQSILQEDNVWGAFGCHPKSVNHFTPEKEMFLRNVMSNPKVVALGEIGLDYSNRFKEQSEQQKEAFVKQLHIALKYQKPLVIHCRQAEADCLQIMKKYVPHDWPIHRHCFTDDWNTARPWMDYFTNCYIGLTPVVTYKTAREVHEVAITLPLERLLLETDAPYFVPYYVSRSQMTYNTPGMAICVADEVARLRACDFDDVLRHARSNTRKMYGV